MYYRCFVTQARHDCLQEKHIEDTTKFSLCNRLVQVAHHSLLDAEAMRASEGAILEGVRTIYLSTVE